jgi:hypothetical protein
MYSFQKVTAKYSIAKACEKYNMINIFFICPNLLYCQYFSFAKKEAKIMGIF